MGTDNSNIWFWVLAAIAVAIIAWALNSAYHVTKHDGYGTPPVTTGDPP